MKTVLIFIDGLGIGNNNPETNPFYAANLKHFMYLIKTYGYYMTDATLEVTGLPQSATGQTTLYTGVNAAKAIGRHWSARPTQALRDIIMEDNIFISLKNVGKSVTFANVYTTEYLEQMDKNPRGIFKPSVTSLLCLSSHTPFRLLEDYQMGYGVFHDITGRRLQEYGYTIPLITPQVAAQNLYRISRDYDLTLFESFMTDLVGHSRDMDKAILELELIDQMLGSLLELMDLKRDCIIITSDHGNIEDLTVKTHTMNPVPTIIASDAVDRSTLYIQSLMDIKPAVMQIVKG